MIMANNPAGNRASSKNNDAALAPDDKINRTDDAASQRHIDTENSESRRDVKSGPFAGQRVSFVGEDGDATPATITFVHDKGDETLVDVHLNPDAPERESRGALRYADNDDDARTLARQGHGVVRPDEEAQREQDEKDAEREQAEQNTRDAGKSDARESRNGQE